MTRARISEILGGIAKLAAIPLIGILVTLGLIELLGGPRARMDRNVLVANVARGQTVALSVPGGRSIQGRWKSPTGFSGTLKSRETGVSVEVTIAGRDDKWGEIIYHGERGRGDVRPLARPAG